MPGSRDDAAMVHAETRQQWRDWLHAHHGQGSGAWLVTWRKASGKPAPTYEEAVQEALCFGWIDSSGRTLDDERSALWFAPRKARSGWARTNKVRVERLIADGLMTEAGLRVIERAKADGSWTLLDDVENLLIPDDLAAAFATLPGSRENFENFTRSKRRAVLEWIVQARRPPTRAKRIEETARLARDGKVANEWKPKG